MVRILKSTLSIPVQKNLTPPRLYSNLFCDVEVSSCVIIKHYCNLALHGRRHQMNKSAHPRLHPSFQLTSNPVGDILRYSLTSLSFSIALQLDIDTDSYVYGLPSTGTVMENNKYMMININNNV